MCNLFIMKVPSPPLISPFLILWFQMISSEFWEALHRNTMHSFCDSFAWIVAVSSSQFWGFQKQKKIFFFWGGTDQWGASPCISNHHLRSFWHHLPHLPGHRPGGWGGWCVISPRSLERVISSHSRGLALPPPTNPTTCRQSCLSTLLLFVCIFSSMRSEHSVSLSSSFLVCKWWGGPEGVGLAGRNLSSSPPTPLQA